jgi:hypothetical protein
LRNNICGVLEVRGLRAGNYIADICGSLHVLLRKVLESSEQRGNASLVKKYDVESRY